MATGCDSAKLRRVGVHALLGFASGVPFFLLRNTLATWFGSVGVDKERALLFVLVVLPFNLKILWAPVLDRLTLPWLDRRRDWMITFQLALAAGLAVLGAMDPTAMLGGMAVVGFALSFVSASHDIVLDGYRTDSVAKDERGKSTGLYVSGYRAAMIVSSAGVLFIADWHSWRLGYWAMAALMAVGVGATLIAPPLASQVRPASLRRSFIDPVRELAGRPHAVVIVAFVMLFKFGDTVASPMIDYFLAAEDGGGYSLTEIAAARKGLGMITAMAGALIGGFWADRLGPRKSLLLFGIAQAFANVGYAALAVAAEPTLVGLSVAVAIDQVFAGMGATAFVAYIMSLCDRRYTVAQLALFTSASTLLGHTLGAGSGYLVTDIGWAWGFVATIVVAIPALVLIRWLPDESPSNDAGAS
jgi:PAT family beta-lactamase induction signal transducer AmpG